MREPDLLAFGLERNSRAAENHRQAYAPMRGLVMDFRTDVRAANIGDQFMFGPAFMVKPVTEPAATSARLYLPQLKWYDFWSGVQVQGARTLDAPSPLDRLPLYIRAGSVLPMGPDIQWSTEKPADPIELRVYRGADGRPRQGTFGFV